LGNPEKHAPNEYMAGLLAHGKLYLGSWSRRPDEGLEPYLARMLGMAGGQGKGLIFLLTPQELGADSPAKPTRLWYALQGATG
jgi:hypothetical protein